MILFWSLGYAHFHIFAGLNKNIYIYVVVLGEQDYIYVYIHLSLVSSALYQVFLWFIIIKYIKVDYRSGVINVVSLSLFEVIVTICCEEDTFL